MKNKKRRILILSFIIMIIAVLIIGFSTNEITIQQIDENIRRNLYGDPIDLETGMINNEYFKISNDGTNATDTTKGLNEALKYSNINNIKYVKIQNGNYLINGTIRIYSNTEIDLNASELVLQANNRTGYTILGISNAENITIKNGKVIGDRENHDYTGDSTHEWGMGINISGSTNINIENLEISDMTGDGIYITNGITNSTSIRIQNCILQGNRRQGISIISGEEIEIYNNEIYKIDGTNPQSGIDLEANYESQKIDKVNIYNNKFYNFRKNIAIILHNQIYNVNITGNLIYGDINIYETKEKTEIVGNQLINGVINAGSSNENNLKIVNNLDILNNKLENYEILYNEKVNNIKIEGNEEN